MSSVRICCLSDTHLLHRETEIAPGQILLHAGDFGMWSYIDNDAADFNRWLGELPFRHRIVVPGNHQFWLAEDHRRRKLLSNATVLINQSITVVDLKIWGSPVTPLSGGAFGVDSPEERAALYKTIPTDTDVVITHGPPYGILDCPRQGYTHRMPAVA